MTSNLTSAAVCGRVRSQPRWPLPLAGVAAPVQAAWVPESRSNSSYPPAPAAVPTRWRA
jgi:hypothetical protein